MGDFDGYDWKAIGKLIGGRARRVEPGLVWLSLWVGEDGWANLTQGSHDLLICPAASIAPFPVEQRYVEEIDDSQLLEYAIQGMLMGLDPHSIYLTDGRAILLSTRA